MNSKNWGYFAAGEPCHQNFLMEAIPNITMLSVNNRRMVSTHSQGSWRSLTLSRLKLFVVNSMEKCYSGSKSKDKLQTSWVFIITHLWVSIFTSLTYTESDSPISLILFIKKFAILQLCLLIYCHWLQTLKQIEFLPNPCTCCLQTPPTAAFKNPEQQLSSELLKMISCSVVFSSDR